MAWGVPEGGEVPGPVRSVLRALGERLPVPLRRVLRRVPGVHELRDRLNDRPSAEPPTPGQKRAIVYLPTWARWDAMRQRPQYLLAAFAAAGHDVYFVDPRETRPRMSAGVSIVPSLKYVPGSGVILYVHFAPVRTMFDAFDGAVIVYDILDDLSIYDADEAGLAPRRKVASHHPLVMDEADIVLVSNSVLYDRHRSERGDLILVENGVDIDRFTPDAAVPDRTASSGGPVIGYHGAVAPWFDFDLVAEVAALRPDWRLVLVGPVDPRCTREAAALDEHPNVELVGEVSSDDVPERVRSMDVGMVPFAVTDMTRGVTPLKMYEYMACSVPVVATELPACVSNPLVRTAPTPASFVDQVEAALGEIDEAGVRAALRAAGEEAAWSRRLSPALRRLSAMAKDVV